MRLRPDWGGRVTRLWHEVLGDLLVPIDESQPFEPWAWPKGGAYPLIPFHGRIEGGRFAWHGHEKQITRHPAAGGHALHGHVHRRAWTVRSAEGARACLEISHRGDADWPFDFDAAQEFHLLDDGLEVLLSISNTGDAEMPYDLGWHPYFPKATKFETDAKGHWPQGERASLPSGALETPVPDGLAGRTHFLDGWTRFDVLEPYRLSLRASSNARHLVIHDDPPNYTCAEPACAPPNAVNLGCAPVLKPGETASMTVSLSMR